MALVVTFRFHFFFGEGGGVQAAVCTAGKRGVANLWAASMDGRSEVSLSIGVLCVVSKDRVVRSSYHMASQPILHTCTPTHTHIQHAYTQTPQRRENTVHDILFYPSQRLAVAFV